jgi:hypothetical protein
VRRAQELTKARFAQLDTTNGNGQTPTAPEPVEEARVWRSNTTPVPLPEAPVSITLKATLHGHEVMVTLRGTDFASVKAQVERASEWLKVQTPAQQGEGWCGKHGVAMKLNHGKNGSTWWSHHTAEGWCKGK